MNIAALVVGPVAVPYLASALGLWKGRQWGWVVAVATNALAAAVFIMDAIDQRHVAWDDAFVAAIFPVLLIMLFLRPVRAWCWRRSSLRPRASGVVA